MKALEILRNDNVFDEEYLSWNKIDISGAISELEEAMKPKTCDGCFYWDSVELSKIKTLSFCRFLNVGTTNKFYCKKHKPKDNT